MAVEALCAEALRAAESDPHRALALVGEIEDIGRESPDSVSGISAGLREWARGRASGQLGRHREAVPAIERAVSLLQAGGDRRAAASASVSLAAERLNEGRFDDAIDLLETAIVDLDGGDAARAAAQRALILQRGGRVVDSKEDWDRAIDAFRDAGMVIEEARAREARGLVHAYRGELDAADDDLRAAAAAFAAADDVIAGVEVVHNQGFVAARRGDLPRALRLFDQAQSRATQLGVLRPEILIDRAEVVLDAGLSEEGRSLAEAAVGILERAGFDAHVPEACLLAARACEQDNVPVRAVQWAERAEELFAEQDRPRWQLLAQFAVLRSRPVTDPVGTANHLVEVAAELRGAGWQGEAVEAAVRAVDLLVDANLPGDTAAILEGLLARIDRAAPLSQLVVRLCQTRVHLAAGDTERAEESLVAGLRALSSYLATLGSIELRTRGAGRAEEVIALGVAIAVAVGRPARALWWMEQVRFEQNAVSTTGLMEPETRAALQSLRDVTTRLNTESLSPAEQTRVRRDQAALEELVRRHSRHATGTTQSQPVDMDVLVEVLGYRTLVEYAVVGDRLVAVVARSNEVRTVDVVSITDARRAVAGLRQLFRTVVTNRPDSLPSLFGATRSVEEMIIDPLGLDPSSDLVIVGAPSVTSMPWSLLPGLERTNLVVTPSATTWLRSRQQARRLDSGSKVVVVVGPDLGHGREEADAVAVAWDGHVSILDGANATVEQVLVAIAESDMVHLVAHGSYRGDNPLLSAVRLYDGHLTGYELAHAAKDTPLVVLSCCDTGTSDTTSGIGLSALLASAGVTTTIASVSPVADGPAVELMAELHRALTFQHPPGRALANARRAVGGLAGSPSSAGFVCFGYG